MLVIIQIPFLIPSVFTDKYSSSSLHPVLCFYVKYLMWLQQFPEETYLILPATFSVGYQIYVGFFFFCTHSAKVTLCKKFNNLYMMTRSD